MLNNLINFRGDLLRTLERVKRGELSSIAAKLLKSKNKRVISSWSFTDKTPTSWVDIPEVAKRLNYLASGNSEVDYFKYFSKKYLATKKDLSILSLGCGCGERELKCAELGMFSKIDAYDISEDRINYANKNACEKGYGNIIRYKAADVNDIKSDENGYDVVLIEQSLHHFTPLKDILEKIKGFMRPGGYIILNEFVGPARFQWSDRQLEVIIGLLGVLPHEYRKKWKTNNLKKEVYRNGRLAMALFDPSEAVESSRIMPLMSEMFEPLEIRELGGTILMLLFNEIAHNFIKDDDKTKNLIKFCFEAEDILLKSEEIKSDMIVAIYKKRD